LAALTRLRSSFSHADAGQSDLVSTVGHHFGLDDQRLSELGW